MTLFFPASLEESKTKETIQKIRQMIEQKGGEIDKAPVFELSVAEGKSEKISLEKFKKELAYPVKKHQVVFCFNIDFNLNEELMADFQNQLKLEKTIIRFLIAAKRPVAGAAESLSTAKLDEKIDSLIDQEIPLSANGRVVARPSEKLSEKTAEPKTAPESDLSPNKSKTKIEDLDKKLEEILNQ